MIMPSIDLSNPTVLAAFVAGVVAIVVAVVNTVTKIIEIRAANSKWRLELRLAEARTLMNQVATETHEATSVHPKELRKWYDEHVGNSDLISGVVKQASASPEVFNRALRNYIAEQHQTLRPVRNVLLDQTHRVVQLNIRPHPWFRAQYRIGLSVQEFTKALGDYNTLLINLTTRKMAESEPGYQDPSLQHSKELFAVLHQIAQPIRNSLNSDEVSRARVELLTASAHLQQVISDELTAPGIVLLIANRRAYARLRRKRKKPNAG